MRKVLLLIAFLSFSGFASEIIIIGSVHLPSAAYNKSDLVEFIESLEPDVVLTEGDSSMFNTDGTVKEGLEALEAQAYVELQRKKRLPVVNISMANRNKLMAELNYSETLGAGFQKIQQRYAEGSLVESELFDHVLSTFPSRNSCLNESNLSEMNSALCLTAMKENYLAIFSTMAEIIGAEEGLTTLHQDWLNITAFHELRDRKMAQNAIAEVKRSKKQKYVMVVGLMHLPVVAEKLDLLLGNEIKLVAFNNTPFGK